MLRRTQASFAIGLLLLAAPAVMTRAADDPAKALDGDWEIQSVLRDGKEQPMPPDAPHPVMTIKGQTATIKIGDMTHTATIKVDASLSPKTIDVVPDDGPEKGKTIQGVYELKDDELRICHGEASRQRPAALASKEGDGNTLVTLKRVKK